MIQLIWAVLNLVILIYFIIICFKSTRVIREKLGVLAAFVFILGLLSLIGTPNNEHETQKIFDLQNKAEADPFKGNTRLIESKLEDNLTTEIQLTIKVEENKNERKPLTAFTNRSGFVMGTSWKTEMITVNHSETENKYFYEVFGTLEWKLMGLKMYSQRKKFKGECK